MGNFLKNHHNKNMLRFTGFFAIVMLVTNITRSAMAVRREGMDFFPALWTGLCHAILYFPATLVGLSIGFLAIMFIQNRKIPEGTPPVEAGQIRYQRRRIFGMIGLGMTLLLTAVFTVLSYKQGNEHFERDAPLLIGLTIIAALILFFISSIRPTREGYYALETGDTSRMNDERMQTVTGKGANTAIYIFLAFLALVMLPYQAIASGHLPIETLVEIGVLLIVQIACFNYWNNKI